MRKKIAYIFNHIKKLIYSCFLLALNNTQKSCLLCFFFLMCFFISPLYAAPNINKNDLKAAYLYKIIKFVEWPNNAFNTPNSTFNMCVVGENPFGAFFYGLMDQQIQGHTLHIEHINDHKKLTDCHMLYIAMDEKKAVKKLIKQLQKLPVLTVSDLPDFAKKQGMIEFITQNNRIGFEINLNSALLSHISIRAELLEVAHKVIKQKEGL